MEFENLFDNAFEIKLLKENSWQIKTSAFLPNGMPFFAFVDKTTNGYIVSDKKQTLKYMSTIYDLNSADIKSCINGVLKVNKFRIVNGIIASEFIAENRLLNKITELIMCMGQMVYMLVFFEEPKK